MGLGWRAMERTRMDDASDQLIEAIGRRERIALAAWRRPANLADAERVHLAVAARLGHHQTGWKIAASTAAAQQRRGLARPLYGRIYRELTFPDGAEIPLDLFIEPHLEVEFAFRFGAHLGADDAPVSRATIIGAIDAVLPAIEIVDARQEGWRDCDGPSLLADNVIHGASVLGRPVAAWRALDLGSMATLLRLDGVEVAVGRGDAVGGDPVDLVCWFVNKLIEDGHAIVPDDTVLSGMTSGLIPLDAGRTVEAEFGEVGRLGVRFVEQG